MSDGEICLEWAVYGLNENCQDALLGQMGAHRVHASGTPRYLY